MAFHSLLYTSFGGVFLCPWIGLSVKINQIKVFANSINEVSIEQDDCIVSITTDMAELVIAAIREQAHIAIGQQSEDEEGI